MLVIPALRDCIGLGKKVAKVSCVLATRVKSMATIPKVKEKSVQVLSFTRDDMVYKEDGGRYMLATLQ